MSAAAARGAGLENTTDNFSPPKPVDAHAGRWFKHDWLRRESTIERQRVCMSRAYGENVTVRKGEFSASLGGVMACGSRTCPVCSPNLFARNRADIEQAVRAWREGEGGTVLFGTFTVRHSRRDSFDSLKEAVSAGWHAVTGGKGWLLDRRRHGVEHWIRVFEEKWSPDNGWHLHVHYLMFIRPGAPIGVDDLLSGMFRRWRRAVVALGFRAPLKRAQDLHEVGGDFAPELLGAYFAKQSVATEARTAEQLAMELTMRDGKFSLSHDSFTPGELLTLAVSGFEDARLKWGEYERGMKKRRVIAWSRGLRDLVGIGDELSDEEAALVETEELRRAVVEMRARGFRKIVLTGRRRELLQRVWDDEADAVLWLQSLGITAVLGTFDRHGEEAAA